MGDRMEGRTLTNMRVEAVRVEGRYRKDLGDLESLTQSLKESGLINPITVTSDGRLIAGQRRLEAARRLGWETIPAVTVAAFDEAVAKLRAERDENVERKEMLVSERVALAEALEELERPRAVERIREARSRAGKIRQGTFDPATVSTEAGAGRASELAARAVDLAPTSYYKARMVVKSASDPDLPPEIRKIAKRAAVDMDATGNIAGNYDRVRQAKAGKEARPPSSGRTRRPITDAARDAGWKLRKEMEKVERLIVDDRFRTNREEVATHLRGHLTYAMETAQRILDALNKESSNE